MTAFRLRHLALLLCALAAWHVTAGLPTSRHNDDTCDIALLPAATLLLPYFEVDISAASGQGETTLFTVTNVTNEEQIAHVTLWTDFAFPVIDFNLYLTGYDTQSINLYDVIALGQLAQPGTGPEVAPGGAWSHANDDVNLTNCHNLPSSIPTPYVTRMKEAFTNGRVPSSDGNAACTNIGGAHVNAVGYATIDLVNSCVATTVLDPAYAVLFLRHDNVLVGDSIQVNGSQSFAQGSPMVHIRAMADDGRPVNFERTFYGHYQPADHPKADRRQPLPGTFAARWINGSAGSFQTALKIWREASTGAGATCPDYSAKVPTYRELTTFDDEENGFGIDRPQLCPPCIESHLSLPSAGRYPVETRDSKFPHPHNGAVHGWIYLNLALEFEEGARQAWVVTSMRAEGRYSADSDATALGNGCTPTIPLTELDSSGTGVLGPAPNINP